LSAHATFNGQAPHAEYVPARGLLRRLALVVLDDRDDLDIDPLGLLGDKR
jgi:hypothetical protein